MVTVTISYITQHTCQLDFPTKCIDHEFDRGNQLIRYIIRSLSLVHTHVYAPSLGHELPD